MYNSAIEPLHPDELIRNYEELKEFIFKKI